jgi:hypothetical protein
VFLAPKSQLFSENNFVVNSGFFSHMTNNAELLREMKIQELKIAVAKKGETIESLCVGTLESGNIVLNDVLYAPNLSKNVFSVNVITENGGEVHFTKNAVIITKDHELVLKGVKQNNGFIRLTWMKKISKQH